MCDEGGDDECDKYQQLHVMLKGDDDEHMPKYSTKGIMMT